jgi:ABC-2 type transport system ATP-binding protein
MIVVEHVNKYYGSHAAVRDLDFRITEGECVGFLGLNGAGKTTTLRLLSCLLLPTSGRITVKGFDVEDQPHEIRKLIGFLPDRPPVYPEMTVTRFLEFAGKLRKMSVEAVKKRLPAVIDVCALEDVADDPIQTLSHGYQQRVGIAQAIIHDPALLILDEPIQGLDPVQIVEMREMIRGLRGKHTILLSTHILSEIEETCDRILMLNQGRVAAQGTEEELAERFGHKGHRVIKVLVRVPSPTPEGAVTAVLEKLEGVSTVDSTPLDDRRISELTVRALGDLREEVARTLVTSGFGLLRFEEEASGLEEIFVKLSHGDRAAGRAS